MKFVNLMPGNDFRLYAEDGSVLLHLPKCEGQPATASVTSVPAEDIEGFPTVRVTYGPVTGLPSPEEGVTYVVSALIVNHADVKGRMDVVAPDTNPPSVWPNGPQGFGVRRMIRPSSN